MIIVTNLLQGGDAKMLLVVTVSPSMLCLRETMHAMSFGVRYEARCLLNRRDSIALR